LKRFITTAAVAAALALVLGANANAVGTTSPVTVVAHLDVARTGLDNALVYLRDYIATSEQQPGAMRIELLRQVTNSNHFTLVEVWANDQAYEAHIASAPVRAFHAKLDPLLGSPHDERLFSIVAGNP